MKKMSKFFNVTVGGWYLCSAVLGVLIYLLALVLPHDLDSWVFYQYKMEGQGLMGFWPSRMDYFLPSAKLYNWLYIDGCSYAPDFAVTVAILFIILSVMMMEGKGMNKVWRTKILQAIGFAGVLICADLAYQYARLVDYVRTVFPMVIFIPIIIMLAPLLVLAKTRQRTKKETKANAEVETVA